MVVLAVCAMTRVGGQEREEVLTNADIVTLTEADLSLSAILTVIESMRTDFDITVAQLAALSRAGVDSMVIEAMVHAASERRGAEEAGLLDEYILLIENRIQQNWVPPTSAVAGLECVVNVTQIPSGDIVDVRVGRNGPRKLDSAVSEILHGIQAAKLRLAWSKYTSSGVRRSSAL